MDYIQCELFFKKLLPTIWLASKWAIGSVQTDAMYGDS